MPVASSGGSEQIRVAAQALLDSPTDWDPDRFSIVGSYVRFDELERGRLNDFRQQVEATFTGNSTEPRNFLLWGAPGSGKSYLVQQIARELNGKVGYFELNLGQLDEVGFRKGLDDVLSSAEPAFCFVDEIDSQADRGWPYELLLPLLEPPKRRASPTCFVLAGSSGATLEDMRQAIARRSKGPDLLSRVPRGHEFQVSRLDAGDRILVAITQLLIGAAAEGRPVHDIEKLALFYIACQPEFESARQVRAIAAQCAQRIPPGENSIRYDYLFRAGDPENKSFWAESAAVHDRFAGRFIRVRLPNAESYSPKQGRRRFPAPLRAAAESDPATRVAVLPLANISPNPSDEYFSDGMTEELISAVSRIPGLSVISRGSVLVYKNRTARASEIAEELGANTLVEGTVRKAGQQVRISAQIIDAVSDRQVWSETFDRPLEDVFAIQSEIARQVAAALELRFRPRGEEPDAKPAPPGGEAYTSYLKGRFFWNRLTKEWLEKATEQYEKSIQLDPTYAPAYAGLSNVFLLRGRRGDLPPQEAYPRAAELARRSLALDRGLSEPHYVLGSILQEYEWRWAESEAQFREALARNPNDSVSHIYFGLFLGHVGRAREGVNEARIAQELDPLSPRVHTGASEEYLFAREYEHAIEAARRALEVEPEYGASHAYIAQALVEMGRWSEAVDELAIADRMLGGQAVKGRLGHALAKAGREQEAREILSALRGGSADTVGWNPFLASHSYLSLDIGLVHLGLGEGLNAIEWLERARDAHVPEVVHFAHEPIYDSIRAQPKFQAILKSIGLAKPL